MTRAGNIMLDEGDIFPDMELSLTNDETILLSEFSKNNWLIILIYRGHW